MMNAGPSPEPHPFDAATALEAMPDGTWRGETSDDYWNMVGPFGGIVAACLLRAALDHPERRGEPVALTVNFCAALARGEFTIAARPARTNRSTQHWTMEMRQGEDDLVATATALFGARPHTFEHRPAAPPPVPAFEQVARFAAPNLGWTQLYDFRFVAGALERDGEGDETGPTQSILWVRSIPPSPLDFLGLAALCDIFFGRIIHVRRRMLPFGTVSMTAYFHASAADLAAQGDRPVLGRADSRVFERGFHDQSAELWSADGRLLATSHQAVYFRDP